jgi:hypothetical protein
MTKVMHPPKAESQIAAGEGENNKNKFQKK